jgi:tetratricopeptide (TPR) repeat protein
MTANARLLLVLDNVSQDAQVTALLPNSPRSMVLAAGNRTLESLLLDGAIDVELRSLDQSHAVELLTAMCPDGRIAAEPEQAQVLVSLCARLPLALRVVGVRLASHPTWTLSRLVGELSDLSEMLDELVSDGAPVVRAVFDLVYDDMPEATTRVYRMLGLLVGPHFSVEVVAAMAELPVRTVRRVLDELVRLNMVEERVDGGFQLHRLVRLHALGRSLAEDTDEERVAVLRRALRWWLAGAVAADVAVTGWERLRVADPRKLLGDAVVDLTRAVALDWLEREHASLIGLMRAAAEHEWHDEVGQLFEALYAYYDNRQPLAAWIEAGELAVATAQRSGNKAAEARTRCQLARALQLSERFADARAHLTVARTLADDIDERLFASTLDFTGNVCLAEGDYETALAYFQRALAINRRLGRARGTALLCWLSGQALAKLGHTGEALRTLAEARALMQAADAASLLPQVVLSIGDVLLDADRVDEASTTADEARELARASGLTAAEADALVLLARIARSAGDGEAERDWLRQAHAVFARMGSPRAARIHAELADS